LNVKSCFALFTFRFGDSDSYLSFMLGFLWCLAYTLWPRFNTLAEASHATFIKITGLKESQSLNVQIQRTIENRGFGLLPIDLLHAHISQASYNIALPFIDQLKLKALPIGTPTSSTITEWAHCIPFTHPNKGVTQLHCQVSILKMWPTNKWTTLHDNEFDFAIRLLSNQLVPLPYKCPNQNIELLSLSPENYTQHFITCLHCGATAFHQRHERIVYCISKVLRFAGITSTPNPQGMALPGKTRGGADILVYTDNIDAVDVAVCKDKAKETYSNSILLATSKKLATYAEFAKRTGFTTVPFVMSIYGEHGKHATDAAQRWARHANCRNTKNDILNYTAAELVRGMLNGYLTLHARQGSEAQM